MEPAGWRNDGCTSLVGDPNLSGQNNNNFTNNAWNMTNNNNNIWDVSANVISTTCYDDWTDQAAATNVPATSVVHALLLGSNTSNLPDPHMMCLKLGKRHYCDNTVVPRRYVAAESSSAAKRCRPPYSCYVTAVARCQVEGCHVALDNVKEYYKKHKVCEIHSKAPKVVVLGIQQRFCQQCSRFHGVTEFDEAKRSCRRRLEGHNQRRRKGTTTSISSLPRNFPHSQENYNLMMEQRLQSLCTSPPPPPKSKHGYALSLLSSPKIEPWMISSGDLSSRCSDALYELIVANRAASVAGHFLSHQNSSHQAVTGNTMYTQHNSQMWDRFNDEDHTTMTLDLMEPPALDFGLLSMKGKSKEPEEWTEYCWSAFGGANVV